MLSGVATALSLAQPSKTVSLTGCGTKLPKYEYRLETPVYWRIDQTAHNKWSSQHELSGLGGILTIGCTHQGIGGDVCDSKDKVKFMIQGEIFEACFAKINGTWKMGVLNLPVDPSTNATISFWSKGLRKDQIEKIISSLRMDNK